MGREATSRTREEQWPEETVFQTHHYVTKISDGRHTVEGRGKDAEESQKIASEKWDDIMECPECGSDEYDPDEETCPDCGYGEDD